VISSKLRRAMKGWGANCDCARRKHKQEILLEIKILDGKSDLMQLSEEEWKRRYELENELQEIYVVEELYWQKRGEKWILKGDSNTSFFHKCANGRKRKSRITSLEDGERVVSDDEEPRRHITDYYKMLFG